MALADASLVAAAEALNRRMNAKQVEKILKKYRFQSRATIGLLARHLSRAQIGK